MSFWGLLLIPRCSFYHLNKIWCLQCQNTKEAQESCSAMMSIRLKSGVLDLRLWPIPPPPALPPTALTWTDGFLWKQGFNHLIPKVPSHSRLPHIWEPVLTVLSLFHDSFHPTPLLNFPGYQIIISIFFHIQFPMRKWMSMEAKQIQNGKVRIRTVDKALHKKIKHQWQGKSICWYK